jgi:tRNA pseudouridine38-40 synthase
MELQYDGTGLHGWAKQDGLVTVEGSLESALRVVLGTTPMLQVAGRTDAGVHARRQVVSLDLPSETDLGRLRASLNALTPPGIAITGIVPAPPRFDARKDAVSRIYRYYLCNSPVVPPFWSRYCWHVPEWLDQASMRVAATAAVGRHDFTAFTPTETEHTFFDRLVLRCTWKPVRDGLPSGRPSGHGRGSMVSAGRGGEGGTGAGPGMLYLEIEAEAFLRHMIRVLVGTMVEVGLGKRSSEDFPALLAGAPREAAGPTAPAHGLFFWDVKYRSIRAAPRPNVSDGASSLPCW